MDPQWQYNHLVIPLTFAIVLILVQMMLGLRQRRNPVAVGYFFVLCCLLLLLVTTLLELITLNLNLSLFFADLSFLGISILPIALLGCIMIYVGKSDRFHTWLPWLVIIPVMTNILIWTNPFHHLWRGTPVRDLTTASFPITIYNYGSWFIIHVIFALSLTFLASWFLIRSPQFQEQFYRSRSLMLLIALYLPVSIDILHRAGIELIPHYNLATLSLAVSAVLMGWVLLRYRFLDLMPVARDLVVETMRDLMLVLDDKGCLVDLNQSARQILFQGNRQVVGTGISELLPEHQAVIAQALREDGSSVELEIRQANDVRFYKMGVSPITHPTRGKQGSLLLLHDITTRKQTEQAYYEQGQRIAILEERQRLARELHDSVNQTLFAARVLAELLPKAIQKKPDKAIEYAANIRQHINGTVAEMRLVLLELYPDALEQSDLGTIIRQLCDAHQGATGAQVDFSSTPRIYLDKEVQIAFYRIAQEALHNINKHAQATKVDVSLSCSNQEIQLSIRDNGAGFDMGNTPPDHFGLGNMRQRASDVGAALSIDSKLNEGTVVTVVRKVS
jgi:PAS domain S-box-containing protein